MTDDEKRKLLQQWMDASDEYLLSKQMTEEAERAYLALDNRCLEVFGPVIPARV